MRKKLAKRDCKHIAGTQRGTGKKKGGAVGWEFRPPTKRWGSENVARPGKRDKKSYGGVHGNRVKPGDTARSAKH